MLCIKAVNRLWGRASGYSSRLAWPRQPPGAGENLEQTSCPRYLPLGSGGLLSDGLLIIDSLSDIYRCFLSNISPCDEAYSTIFFLPLPQTSYEPKDVVVSLARCGQNNKRYEIKLAGHVSYVICHILISPSEPVLSCHIPFNVLACQKSWSRALRRPSCRTHVTRFCLNKLRAAIIVWDHTENAPGITVKMLKP